MSAGPARRRRPIDERGQIAGAEMVFLGMLIMLAGTMLVLNVWAVVDTKLAVTAASREAARVMAERGGSAGAVHEAQLAAVSAMAGHGRRLSASQVDVRYGGESLGRCERFTVTVRYRVDAIRLGPFTGIGTRDVRSTHSEIVDPYRSGLSGTGDCGA